MASRFCARYVGYYTYDSLDLPVFVAGYLVMIKHYDTEVSKSMLAIRELLMVKATSYSWHSVRGFYSYVARQVEQRRLEWESIEEIREMASISFKHSDLRSAKVNPLRPPPSQQTNSNPGEQTKSCQAWSYRDSCTYDSETSTYASHHICRVCKSADHPMFHCPKRKMPIPGQQ